MIISDISKVLLLVALLNVKLIVVCTAEVQALHRHRGVSAGGGGGVVVGVILRANLLPRGERYYCSRQNKKTSFDLLLILIPSKEVCWT